MRVAEEVLLDDNGEVYVDGKAENFTKRRVLGRGCDTFQQEIPTDDLDWVFVRVLRTSWGASQRYLAGESSRLEPN